MKEETLKQLREADTLGAMLRILFNTYDLDSTKVTPIVKGTIISGLSAAVKMCNPKPKK